MQKNKKNYHLNINALVLVVLGVRWRQDTREGTEGTTDLGEMESCKNPAHTKLPKSPCFHLCVASDKRHYSISCDTKFPPAVQVPLYHRCYVKASLFLLYLIQLSLPCSYSSQGQTSTTELPHSNVEEKGLTDYA